MRLLRLVGPGGDGKSLLLESADGDEQFTLPIDERLRNVSSSDLPRLPVPESEASKAPSPREIQTRIRAGESAQALADDAGIPVERVMRFAYPVLQERIRVVDEARRARARRGSEGHLVDFGELIDSRLARHGLDPAVTRWDAYRREDGGWTVTAGFTAHEQPLLAKFSFALMNRTVSALDALSSDLLADRPVPALLPPMPTPVEDDPATAAAPVRLTAVPDHVPAAEAAPQVATSPAIRPGRRQKARTRPIPVGEDDELFDQDALGGPEQTPTADWQELPLDLDAGENPAAGNPEPAPETSHKRGRRGDKPRMPSWDDILLGVKHKSD